MGLFGKIKDKIGVGSLKAEILLDQPGFEPGEPVAGKVALHSAASDTQVTSVLLQLVNFGTDVEVTEVVTDDYYYGTSWDSFEKKFKYNQVVFEQYLAQSFTVAAAQKLEFEFNIGTTPDVIPTDKYNGYMLKVHVDIPRQIDTKAAKPVHIMFSGGMPPQMGMGAPPVDQGGDVPQPGERILAYWEEDDCWYECTTNLVDGYGVHVTWDDGSTSQVPFDMIRPSEGSMPGSYDLSPGMRVMAKYGEGWYEAGVSLATPQQVMILWDDGSQSPVNYADVRLF